MLNHSVYRLGTSTAAFDAEISLTPSYACQDDLISPPTSRSGHLSTVNYSRPGAHGLPSYSWRQVHASNPVSAQPYTSRKRTAVPPPEDGPLPDFLVHEIQESTRALVHALRTQESHRAVVQSTTEQVPVISKSGPMLMQHSTTEEIEDSVFHALLVVQHRATMILLQRHRRVVLIRYWIRWMSIWHHRAHERFRMQIREKTAADADLLAAVAKEKQLNTTLQRQVAENEQELHLAREKLAAQRNVHDEDLAREIAIWRERLNEASRAHERGQTALEGELEEAKTRRREVEELLRLETRQKNSVEEKLHRMEQLCKRSEEELNDLTASHQFLKDNLSKKDRHCRGLEEELAETKVLCRRYQLERDEEANRRTQIEAALNQHRNTATAPSMHHEKSRKSHGDFSLSIPSMDRSLDPRAVANVLQRTVDVARRARVWAAWWCWIEVRRGVHRQNQAEKIQSIKRKEALDQALAAQEKAEKDAKETTNTLQRMMYEKSMVQNSVSELVTLMSLHMDEVLNM